MAVSKKKEAASDATPTNQPSVQHVVLDDRLFHETARTLIYDDVQATQLVLDPANQAKNSSLESSITFHPSGVKKRKHGKGVQKRKGDDEDASLSYKVCCCCFYLGNRYLKISFGYIMMAIIVAMIAFVAYLKFGENIFFFQAVHDLEEIDYYKVLEVDRSAPLKLIKKAHRDQSRKWHPDRNPDCGEECVKKMTLISEAYTVLSNKELTDWHLANGLRVPDSMIKKHASRAKN